MSIAISDALQQAQQAIEGGDYQSAIQTCNQLVSQFPDYAAAYRVLGEAYLEQGQRADAEQAFAQALTRDPRQPWAYHGLGLIAESQEVLENALAFCQVAWELAPHYPRLREPVIRIATRRFGADGQAQLTSAALAQIYANTSRLQRAATEFRNALVDLPDRVDLKLGLAETLWQLGQDDEAADLCRQVLEENPVAIQALIVLADIEGRAGQEAEAADLRARIRAIDPDGAVAAMMVARNERAQAEALLVSASDIPVLDAAAEAVVAERPHIAPAPDFSYQPARAEQPVQDIEDLEPISAEEFGTLADDFAGASDAEVTTELEALGVTEPTASFPEDAPSIYRAGDDDEASRDLRQEIAASEPPAPVSESAVEDDLDALLAEFGDVEPMGIEEFGAEPEDVERLASGQDLFEDGADDLFAGFTPAEDAAAGDNEHVRSLASALEPDVAGVLGRTGEFGIVQPEAEMSAEPEPDHEPETEIDVMPPSVPDQTSGTGYTTMLEELGDEGFTPFDPMGRVEMQDSPAQAHFAGGDSAGEGDVDMTSDNELARLTEDWESIDDEIARAMPITTGQTDQLRAADDLGIDPFDFEVEDDTSRLPAYRPFGEDDDELRDLRVEDAGTAEAQPDIGVEADDRVAAETPVMRPEPEAAQPEAGDEPEADLLDNLEPFSLEEFEDADDQPFSFGALPWERGESGSAVPSDEDLDRLLDPDIQAKQPEPEHIEPDSPTQALDTMLTPSDEPVDWTVAIQDDVVVEDEPEPAGEATPEQPSTAWGVPSDWDASLAVTRQIGDQPHDFGAWTAESETEAPAEAEPDADEVPETTAPTSGLLSAADPEKLVASADLFERTRSAKEDLIAQGTISGHLDLGTTELDAVVEPVAELEPVPTPEPSVESVVDVPEDDFVVSTGASRDVNTLRASLAAAPEDDELHWWLAEALRERGDIDEAYVEYRWLIRHAGHRSDDVIGALNACVESEQYAEMGHRLLADVYRRRGAVSLASSHAATAMAVRRRLRG